MRKEKEEPNYLARTKLKVDPDSFAETVKEAFQLEHHCSENQEIAAILGVDKSRISQIFKDPKILNAKSVKDLVDVIASERHKRRIVRAWIKEAVGMDISPPVRSLHIGDHVTARTLERIDRQIRQRRLTTAALTALQAARKAPPGALREQFLDKAYITRLRLDLPGQAMYVVRMIADGAVERNERLRLGAAHYFRARILMGLQDSKPVEVERALEAAELSLGETPPDSQPPYRICTEEIVRSLRRVATVMFMERGTIPIQKQVLNKLLKELDVERTKRNSPKMRLFASYLLSARIHLLLGDTFQARETLDCAFEFGRVSNPHAREICAVVEAHILAATETPEKVEEFLRTLATNCSHSEDRYDWRVTEYQLARLESELFPPSRPVL